MGLHQRLQRSGIAGAGVDLARAGAQQPLHQGQAEAAVGAGDQGGGGGQIHGRFL